MPSNAPLNPHEGTALSNRDMLIIMLLAAWAFSAKEQASAIAHVLGHDDVVKAIQEIP